MTDDAADAYLVICMWFDCITDLLFRLAEVKEVHEETCMGTGCMVG